MSQVQILSARPEAWKHYVAKALFFLAVGIDTIRHDDRATSASRRSSTVQRAARQSRPATSSNRSGQRAVYVFSVMLGEEWPSCICRVFTSAP